MKKKLEVLQEEISDCGAASLLSIIRYYDGDASLENLRVSSMTTKDGVNMFNLIECAKEYGFDAKGIKEFNINNLTLPCIIHIKINKTLSHFVTLYKVNKDSLLIMDPACGFKNKNIDELNYTGNAIILIPRIKLKKDNNKKKLSNILIKELFNIKEKVILLLSINIIFIILSILNSYYIEFYIKYKSIFIIVIFLIINILTNIISFIINKVSIELSNRIEKNLLSNFFSYIFRLPLKYIHLKSSGEIIKRIHDMENIKDVLLNFIINSFLNIIIIIFILVSLSFIYIKIIPIIVVFIISLIMLTCILYKNINKEINTTIFNSTGYESNLVDYMNGLTSIIHSNSINYFNNLLNISMRKSCNSNKHLSIYNSRLELVKNIFSNSLLLIINSILFIDIINNTIDITKFIIINYLLNIVQSSLESIINYIPSYLYIKNIIRKINEFYLIETKEYGNTSFKNGDITINNLNFSYNKFNKIIKNKNLMIKKGEKIIIKGESGCGKSTLCKIINKEYEYEGSIKINNIELRDIDINSIRKNIVYSSQDEYIFNGTIKDNITLGLNISDDIFNKISEICLLDRIIKNRPLKFDTFLFGGGDLSGGERNLIILARALVRNSNILILDENMKELNEELENQVLNNIFNYYKDKTIIYVSHRNNKNYFNRCINV